MSISLFDTRTMLAALEQMKPAKTFFLDTFFRSVNIAPTKTVDIDIQAQSIHAIIGENGAGKTTIMEILYGFYQADAGRIELFGEPVQISNPQHAIARGIVWASLNNVWCDENETDTLQRLGRLVGRGWEGLGENTKRAVWVAWGEVDVVALLGWGEQRVVIDDEPDWYLEGLARGFAHMLLPEARWGVDRPFPRPIASYARQAPEQFRSWFRQERERMKALRRDFSDEPPLERAKDFLSD